MRNRAMAKVGDLSDFELATHSIILPLLANPHHITEQMVNINYQTLKLKNNYSWN